jgi:hypothetical protein
VQGVSLREVLDLQDTGEMAVEHALKNPHAMNFFLEDLSETPDSPIS